MLSSLHFITIIDILKQKIDLMNRVRIFFVPEVVAKKRKIMPKNRLKIDVSDDIYW
jgi:hypothetical protein